MKITDAHSHLMVKFLMYREAGVEQNIQMMKKGGIDRACLFTSDFLSTDGSLTPKAWEERMNRKIAESVESHPTRLVGFGTVDPRIEGAAERLDSFVAKYGFRGAKFHPWHQDFPCGDVMHPIMEVAARHRISFGNACVRAASGNSLAGGVLPRCTDSPRAHGLDMHVRGCGTRSETVRERVLGDLVHALHTGLGESGFRTRAAQDTVWN